MASLHARIQQLEDWLRGDARRDAVWRRELHQALAESQHVDHAQPVPRDGVDYAFGPADGNRLRRAGVTFVVRYIDSGSGKDLTHAEARQLSSAGLDLAVCRETTAERLLAGYQGGREDAPAALAAAHAAGMPKGRPVYYVADFDAQGAQLEAIAEYLRGAVHATSWHEVGLYGGRRAIAHAAGLNRCRYYWQTLAWSGGVWVPHAQLRQIQIERLVAGVRVDLDRAVAADFGQWRA